jgi:hypothetical protein
MTAGDIRRQLDDDMWDSMLRRTAEYRQELLRKRAAMTTAGDDGTFIGRLGLAAKRLALYTDECALILKQRGYAGKAQSLESKAADVMAALAAAGPGREETIEECRKAAIAECKRWDKNMGSDEGKSISFYINKALRALAAQPIKPLPQEDLTQVVERPQSGSAPRLCNSGQSLREEGPATKSPVEADVLREARDVVEADNRNPGAPGSHSASRARLARALLAMAEKPQS